MAKKRPATESKKTPRFELSLAELEEIVTELEAGDLALSESLERYEKGVKLLQQCHTSLDQVQRKIELLTNVSPQGEKTSVPFDDGETPTESPGRGQSSPAPDDMDESGRLF